MSQQPSPVDPQQLLEHAHWMRAFARSLVLDDSRADDLVQETWLAAVERPPTGVGVAGWLRRVIRNFAYRTHRDDVRRTRREHAAAKPESSRGLAPDELVERTELHRRIVDVVLELDEPVRSTLLMRFFEEMTAKEIADRQSVPYSTVCSRIARGLEVVRRRLDARHGGDRGTWVGLLLPLTGAGVHAIAPASASAATAAAASNAGSTGNLWTAGGLIMSQKLAVATGLSLAILAVGVSIGTLTSSSSSDGWEANGDPLVSSANAAEALADGETAAAGHRGAAGRVSGAGSSISSNPAGSLDDARTQLRAALDRFETGHRGELASPANGTIHGSVIGRSGEPIPGVRIEALPIAITAAPSFEELSEDDKLFASVIAVIESHRSSERERVVAVADENGWFALEGVRRSVLYNVSASLEGWTFDSAEGSERRNVRAGDVVELRGTLTSRVTVNVRFAGGREPDVARVQVRKGNRTDAWVWYPEKTTFSLSPGDYRFRAFFGSERTHMSEPQYRTILGGDQNEPLLLELEARTGIAGRVLVPAGEAPRTIHVYASPASSGGRADAEELARTGARTTASRPEFRFWFKDLPPGEYAVGVGRFPEEIVDSSTVTVENGFTDVELALPALSSDDYLEVAVLDPAGEILPKPRVWLEAAKLSQPAVFVPRPDGTTWLLFPPKFDRTANRTVFAESSKFGREHVDATGLDAVSIQFRDPALLRVIIENYARSPVRGSVRLTLLGGEDRGGGRFRRSWRHSFLKNPLSIEGVQEFGPVSPGEYFVLLSVDKRAVLRERVELRPGDENELRLRLPEYHSLTVVGSGTRASVALRGNETLEGFWLSAENENGRFVFPRLQRGRYLVRIDEQGTTMVDLSGDEVVRFEPDLPAYTVEVLVHDAGGYLARAGFENGDIIVGGNGGRFSSRAELDSFLRSEAEIAFNVWRDGNSVQVSFDPEAAREHPDLGGRFNLLGALDAPGLSWGKGR